MGVLRNITSGFSKSASKADSGKREVQPPEGRAAERLDAGEIERPGAFEPDLDFLRPAASPSSVPSPTPRLGYEAKDRPSDQREPNRTSGSAAPAAGLDGKLPRVAENGLREATAASDGNARAAMTQGVPEVQPSHREHREHQAQPVQPVQQAQPAATEASTSAPAPTSHSKSSSGRRGSSANASSGKRRASDKELQKLRRVDLLELLVDQIRDNDRLTAENEQLTDLTDRLKAKLDDKDAQIEHLKQRLNMKDDQIKHLEERNRSLAHAAGTLDVSELVAIEEHAIDRYLQQLQAQGVIPSVDPSAQAPHGTHMR